MDYDQLEKENIRLKNITDQLINYINNAKKKFFPKDDFPWKKNKSEIQKNNNLLGCIKNHIIIPIHPPRFAFIVNAFSKIEEIIPEDYIIIFVLTSDFDVNTFLNYIDLSNFKFPCEFEAVSAISICENFDLQETKKSIIDNKDNGIVNYKKMVSIYRSACLEADNIICIDSDCIFTKNISSVFDRLKKNFDSGNFIAGHSCLAKNIVLECIKYFKPEDRENILKNYDYGKLYSWFFDVPFYPKKQLYGWLTYIDETYGNIDNAFYNLNWGTFEHMIFQMYCICKEGMNLVDSRPYTGERVPDELWLSEVFNIIDHTGYLPVWCTLGGMIDFVSEEDFKKASSMFLMAMHVDRLPGRLS